MTRTLLLLGSLLVATACAAGQHQKSKPRMWQAPPEPGGASAQPAAPAADADELERREVQAPTEEAGLEEADASEEGYAEPPPAAAPAPAPIQDATPLPAPSPITTAMNDLYRAEARLTAGLGNCRRVCRALASMQRAATRICELEPPPGAGRCQEARRRLIRATTRVRDSCGECARDD